MPALEVGSWQRISWDDEEARGAPDIVTPEGVRLQWIVPDVQQLLARYWEGLVPQQLATAAGRLAKEICLACTLESSGYAPGTG